MKKILIINLGGLGDILLSLPAVNALRRMSPEAKICLLTVPRTATMTEKIAKVDKVYALDRGVGSLFKKLNLLFELRRQHFDLAVNMRSLISTAGAIKLKILLALISPRRSAGRDTEGRGKFFDVRVPEREKSAKHEIAYNKELVQALGAEAVESEIGLPVDAGAAEQIKVILKENGVRDDDILIGIHPGGRISRRWPRENFLALINGLSAKRACRFVISGSAGEETLGAYFKRECGEKVIDLVNRLSIEELFVLIKRCRCFVSNDTGPMHFAALLKTPLVALFGPGDLGHYDPRELSEKVIVLKKDTACAPCARIRCDDLRCLKAISPEETVRAVESLL